MQASCPDSWCLARKWNCCNTADTMSTQTLPVRPSGFPWLRAGVRRPTQVIYQWLKVYWYQRIRSFVAEVYFVGLLGYYKLKYRMAAALIFLPIILNKSLAATCSTALYHSQIVQISNADTMYNKQANDEHFYTVPSPYPKPIQSDFSHCWIWLLSPQTS
jgi:hypothetical protein